MLLKEELAWATDKQLQIISNTLDNICKMDMLLSLKWKA